MRCDTGPRYFFLVVGRIVLHGSEVPISRMVGLIVLHGSEVPFSRMLGRIVFGDAHGMMLK